MLEESRFFIHLNRLRTTNQSATCWSGCYLRCRSRDATSASHALYRAIETLMTPCIVFLLIALARGSNVDPFFNPTRDCASESEMIRVPAVDAGVISYSNSTCLPKCIPNWN